MKYNFFDTLLEPTFVINSELIIIYANEPAALITGLSTRKLSRNQKITEVLIFEDTIESFENLKILTEASPYKEVRFKAPEASEGKVQVTVQPVDSENNEHWIVFIRDVTLEERLQKKYHAELDAKEDVILELQKAQFELQNYSKNLEKMVDERTHEISNLNQQMKALLDSLSQGFFIFNTDGICLEVNSKACMQTIECKPAGKPIWEVLKLPESKIEGFQKWMLTLFSEMLPFEDLAPLGPTTYPHSEGKKIALEYYPLRNEQDLIEGVVVVANDITSLLEAKEQADIEKQKAAMIVNLVKNKKEISRFIFEAQTMLKNVENEISKDSTSWDTELIFRIMHTLKGGAALFSVRDLTQMSHSAEDAIQYFKENPSPEFSIPVKNYIPQLKRQIDLFSQDVVKFIGEKSLSTEKWIEVPKKDLELFCSQLHRSPSTQPIATKIEQQYLLEKIQDSFVVYDDVTQKISIQEGKKVDPIEFVNGKILIDAEKYSPLFNSLIHCFRNSIDHGIESPEIRLEKGKKESGHIRVEFQKIKKNKSNWMLIQISDDGQGINPIKIREKLDKKNIAHSHLNDREVIQKVFSPEFSTKEVVTEISGRGVGMDAVKHSAESLGGKTWVKSKLGQGTTFFIFFPLTEKTTSHLQFKFVA